MAIKTLLILLSLISYPSVSGAEYLHFQKYSPIQGQYQIAQDTDELFGKPKHESYSSPETQTAVKPNKPLKHVSPGWAFFLASIPLTTNLLAWPIEISSKSGEDNPEYRTLNFSPLYALVSFTLFTIPAHVYVHDSFLKYPFIFIGKAISLYVFFDFAANSGRCNRCENGCTGCDDFKDKMGMILGISGFFGIYLYELIDAPLAASRFNEEIKQEQGFYVLPYASKDQYRINLGYQF